MIKTQDEAYILKEGMALKDFQWSNDRGQPKRVGGNIDVDTLTLHTAKMDSMSQRLDCLNVNAMSACALSRTCERCGSLDHLTMHCQVGNSFVPFSSEQVAYVNNFQPRPNHDPYSTPYNPGWKNHPNFFYNEPLPFPQANVGLHPLDFKDHSSLPKIYKILTQK